MTATRAIAIGLARAAGAWRIVAVLWLVNLLVAIPGGLAIGFSLHRAIGASRVAETLRTGFDMTFWGEYREQARGIERTLDPSNAGIGSMLDQIDALLTGRIFALDPTLLAAGALYGLLWLFLLGGVLARLAQPDELHGAGRFAFACGAHFSRLFRLALVGLLLYAALYGLHRAALRGLGEALRETTRERTILVVTLASYGLFAFLLTFVHAALAYAKIEIVVAHRTSALGAARRGFRLVLGHPVKTLGQFYGMLVLWLVVLGAFALVAPIAGPASWPAAVAAFVAAQLFLAVRLGLRLALLGGQIAMHAALVAPADSPLSDP